MESACRAVVVVESDLMFYGEKQRGSCYQCLYCLTFLWKMTVLSETGSAEFLWQENEFAFTCAFDMLTECAASLVNGLGVTDI